MPPKPRGRPPKKKKNISGLRNQPATSSENQLTPILESVGQDVDGDQGRGDGDLPRYDLKDLASSEREEEEDSEFESDYEWKGLTSIEFGKKLAALSSKIDDDQDDTDWIPYRLGRKRGKKKGE